MRLKSGPVDLSGYGVQGVGGIRTDLLVMESLAIGHGSSGVIGMKISCMDVAVTVGWFLIQHIAKFHSGVQEMNLLDGVNLMESQLDGE